MKRTAPDLHQCPRTLKALLRKLWYVRLCVYALYCLYTFEVNELLGLVLLAA